jgi:hypothetical protein
MKCLPDWLRRRLGAGSQQSAATADGMPDVLQTVWPMTDTARDESKS